MLAALIDEHRRLLPRDVIHPPAGELVALRGEVGDRWGERKARAQPRLHGVLVGRGDVDAAAGERGVYMARDGVSARRSVVGGTREEEAKGKGDGGDRGEGWGEDGPALFFRSFEAGGRSVVLGLVANRGGELPQAFVRRAQCRVLRHLALELEARGGV